MKENRTAILTAIRELSVRDAEGRLYSPTLTEICAHLGMSPKSKGSVSVRVSEMIAEGLIVKTRDGPRSLAVVDAEDRRLNALLDAADRPGDRDARRRRFAEVLAAHG